MVFFWLRAPNMNNSNNALVAKPGNYVNNNVNNDNALVLAWPCCQMVDLSRLSRTKGKGIQFLFRETSEKIHAVRRKDGFLFLSVAKQNGLH